MALLVDPLERDRIETSSAPRDVAVDGRDDGADSGCANAAELDEIKRSWSLPSRMGQLRARAPMTSICFRREPWSQYWRICVIFPA
jgi:hypothetical protein